VIENCIAIEFLNRCKGRFEMNKACLVCDEPFWAQRNSQCCSNKCARTHTKAKRVEYRAKNPEKIKASIAKWRAENRDRVAFVKREWAARNRDKVREYEAAYRNKKRHRIAIMDTMYQLNQMENGI
jgi:hypothetical protein